MEAEGMRQQQFPFYNEVHTIFAARMLLMEAEGGGSGALKKKAAVAQLYSDEYINELDSEGEGLVPVTANKKKRKIKGSSSSNPINSSSNLETFKEILDDFKKQQLQMEMQWIKAYEGREEERRERELEWRKTMEALGNERLMMDRRWREREEQRKIREEVRAEKTDALITALLNELQKEDF
ncbi:hypothetical protein M9H77_29220 [Catharanthus roseus]|uniref:Uncharacterized protein n=1 Tax=Catharanthus roseus TaxID=4058 RepID=A0ACC0AJ03_CATRO|nr:hypothetical protein M9H77_29220 [Catharanthus roseus]